MSRSNNFSKNPAWIHLIGSWGVSICFSFWVGVLFAQPCRNVKDFGAKGDGVTDDTEAIRKAFTTAPIPRCIYFPTGIYLIDPDSTAKRNMNVVKSNMLVKGDRGRSAIKIKDKSIVRRGGPVGNLYEQLLLGGNNIKKVVIQDLIFDCNYRGNESVVNTIPNETRGVTFEDVQELTIQNCVFLDAPTACLVLVRCTKNSLINNYLYHVGQGKFNGDAIQLNGCTDSQINRNTLQNVGEGIFCQPHASTHIRDSLAVISLNTIVTLDSGQVSAISAYVHNSILPKLKLGHLLQYKKAGKAIGAAIGVLSNNSQVFNNNIVQHLGIAVQAYKGHGDLPVDGVVVRDNTVLRNAKHSFVIKDGCKVWNAHAGILVSADGQTVKNVKILNNRIVSSYNGGIQFVAGTSDSAFPGIIQGITVTQNTILNACFETCTGYKCAGIDFLNEGLRRRPEAVIKDGQFVNITIKNNQIGYARLYGMWLEPCTSNLSIEQNQFNPGPNAVGLVNFAEGSCIKQLLQPTFPTALLNNLQCIMELGANAVGICPTVKKCAQCN
jgi:Pectate lyase superfamily protein